jgi:hypothetical protein
MTTFNLKKATKTQSRLRMAIFGPSGSGKTYSSLAIAKGLGGKVAVIDTERGSASKYADKFDFDVIELDTFAPQTYAEAIKFIESQGYDVIVIDSLTHAWSGKGGALEQVDNAAKRSQSNNTYTAWRDVTPKHNEMIDAIVGCKAHVIATMRSKTEYVLEANERGRMQPKKLGLAPVQRDGMEYEFDVVGEMNMENELIISKSRCEALTNGVFAKPNGKVSDMLKVWLTDGAPIVDKPAPTTVDATLAELRPIYAEVAAQVKAIGQTPCKPPANPTPAQVQSCIDDMRKMLVDFENAGKPDPFVAAAQALGGVVQPA